MGRLKPTQQELLEIAHNPNAATRLIEKYGLDALMDPYDNEPCDDCEQRRGIGLGDVVAKVTGAVGIKPCGPCEQRRRKLNRWRLGG